MTWDELSVLVGWWPC